MDTAAPDTHLEAFAGWHPAIIDMLSAAPQSPRWGCSPSRRWGAELDGTTATRTPGLVTHGHDVLDLPASKWRSRGPPFYLS